MLRTLLVILSAHAVRVLELVHGGSRWGVVLDLVKGERVALSLAHCSAEKRETVFQPAWSVLPARPCRARK